MADLRQRLYRIYWTLEKAITPGLRSSQYAYHDAVREHTRSRPAWLDLGCGHHIFGSWMDREQAEAAGEARLLVGMDYDLPSLVKHQVIRHRLTGDIAHLPFHDRSFDLITANMVVEHLDDVGASLAEIRRVLRPGGVFVFQTPNYNNHWVFLSSLAPSFLKVMLARVLEGRAESDVFPTHYRMNTCRGIRKHAAGAGFELEKLDLVNTSALTAALGPLSVFELLLLRLLQHPRFSRFRADAIAVLRKPETATLESFSPPTPVSTSSRR